MLLNDILRHRRLVMFLILGFIGLPMLVWIPGRASVADFFKQGPGSAPVARVGKTDVTDEEFIRFYQNVSEQRSQAGQPATARDMVADGTVEMIRERLITEALITEKTRAQPIHPDQKFLEERLRKEPTFKNEKGEFDAGVFNNWVDRSTRARMNWEAVYASVADGVNREKYLELIGAAVRVPESEVHRQFYDQNTKMKIKAAAVAPKVELTEEQLRAYYDANLKDFMTAESRKADFIAISLNAPTPPLVQELIDKAKAGEDFAELAKKNSQGVDADQGGDLGWLTDSSTVRDYEKALFQMQPGEVRGPIESFSGLHIFKLEETRQNDKGVKEVHAREIVIRPELPEAERTAREARAKAMAAKAVAGADLMTLAAAENLEVKRTDSFDNHSQRIEGVSDADAMVFRAEMLKIEKGKISGVIAGPQGLYLAQVAEITPPSQKTFETAHDDVKAAAVRKQKDTPEYQRRVADVIGKIIEKAKSVDDMKSMFPDLDVEIKQSESFGLNDMLFQQGILMDGRTLLSRIVNKKPGDFVGPIYDLLRVPNFVQVVERTVPEGETWEKQYETEKAKIRGDLIRQRRQQLQQDYLSHLRTRFDKDAMIQRDDQEIRKLLRLDEPGKANPATAKAAAPEAKPSDVPMPVIVTPAAEAPALATPAPGAGEPRPAPVTPPPATANPS